jgi:ribosomal protein L31E
MRIKRTVAIFTCACLLGAGALSPAQAVLIRSDQLVVRHAALQSKIDELLLRQQVRDELATRGVHAAELKARVAAMSDDEARQVAAQIDRLPAGGDGVIEVLFAVFIILLITDILGLTKVFPFTHPIRR